MDINISQKINEHRVCWYGPKAYPWDRKVLFKLFVSSLRMVMNLLASHREHQNTPTHARTQKGGLTWHSAWIWRWQEEAFVSLHSCPHADAHTLSDTPSLAWRGVCVFEVRAWGWGEAYSCLLMASSPTRKTIRADDWGREKGVLRKKAFLLFFC